MATLPDPNLPNSENRLLDPSPDVADLQSQLRDQESSYRMQVLHMGVFESGADVENYAYVWSNFHVDKMVPITVVAVPADTAADATKLLQFFNTLAQKNYIFDYAYINITTTDPGSGQTTNADQLVILTRAGILPNAPDFPNSPRLPIPQPSAPGAVHHVKASSFADPGDLAAFKKCKANGGSDQQCFRVGDNGIGFCGADCTGRTPMCALPPDDWLPKWGSKKAANLKPVDVTIKGKTVQCLMGDTMPQRKNITNGAGIDLSPAAVAAFGLKPGIMVPADWAWA